MAEQNLLKREITDEDISTFLNGHDPEERIVNIEYNGRDDKIIVYYRNENDQRCVSNRPFYPFLWAKFSVGVKMKENAAKMAEKGELQAKLRINWEGADFLLKYNSVSCKTLNEYMKASGIWVKMLEIHDKDGNAVPDMENGYCLQFYATRPMAYYDFLDFFKTLGLPVYSKGDDDGQTRNSSKDYLTITPVEQYLISTGKRFFKGYDDYNDLLRMIFDLETTGLDTTKDRIEQFGIRFNRPFKYNGKDMTFERILAVGGDSEEEKDKNELECINIAMQIIQIFKPDVITAHNGENFDWNMIAGACKRLGTSLEEVSKKYFNGQPIYKSERESILKLGGEIEKFNPTIVPGITVTDSLHAVRRAQATDSNFAKGTLKYSIKYLNLQKSNRVYVPGSKITDVWNDMEEHYAFNDSNGDWYLYDPKSDNSYKFDGETERKFIPVYNTVADGYVLKSGRYIVQRYLLDDLWECDKVEYALNVTDFMLTKIIPVTFQRCCTMGTAGQWKSVMMAWSYENGLAIPLAPDTGKFTGGLSRLLSVGYVRNIIKLDYNSLYPSIILTWGIENNNDLLGVTLKMLEYVLTEREKHKKLKKSAGKLNEMYEKMIFDGIKLTDEEDKIYQKAITDYKLEDNQQANFKKFGNSFFGSYGSNRGSVYPWKSVECAERTTCTGRQSLRLMISHFSTIGERNGLGPEYNYKPIVGDSVSGDTPLFIKYIDTGLIDIKPISEIFDEQQSKRDELGREYDVSDKKFYVLCRSGWVKPDYVYRHSTDKAIYRVSDGDMSVDVTEDHSLFDSDKKEIKPCDITESTKLEYYGNKFSSNLLDLSESLVKFYVKMILNGSINRVPLEIINSTKESKKLFYELFMNAYTSDFKCSKTLLAGLLFLKNSVQ